MYSIVVVSRAKLDDKATLIVGADDFPFPIPLVRKQAKWSFDAVAGREEILRRRIGRNELSAIQACLAYYDAQLEYAEKGYAGNGSRAYAQRIVSNLGKKDGLYWPSSTQGEESPLGELIARATAEGYGTERRAPFHGYYYRILTQQGPNAKGAAIDYLAHGAMVGGFALVRLSGELPKFRCDDLRHQPQRYTLSERSGSADRSYRFAHAGIRS